MSKTKKPTAAQLEVLKKMNENNFELRHSVRLQEECQYFKIGNVHFLGWVNLGTFRALLNKNLIFTPQKQEGQDNFYYRISELGKQALNEQS